MATAEEWRAIPGYEGLYEVSNKGNVRSLDRYVKSKLPGFKEFVKGKPLVAIKNTHGYLRVNLCDEHGRKAKFIHRLVCLAFLPNPKNFESINHKDENPLNNCVENLEWCTTKYNANYGSRNKRVSESNSGKKKTYTKESRERMIAPKRVAVIGINSITGEELHVRSVTETKIYGFNPVGVSHCLMMRQKSHRGYTWRYANGNR